MLRIIAVALFILACTKAQQTLVQCAGTEALKVLPVDPKQATADDAIDLVQRLNACRSGSVDSGAP